MDDDIRYYGLTFPELLALTILWQGFKIVRTVLLECDDDARIDVSASAD